MEVGELTVEVFIALVELFKKSLGLPVRYAPLVSVLLGVPVGILYLDVDLKTGIVYGLIIGLSACGLYSGAKSITK
ncbi:transposase [Cytobacillus oceanisediminis]|uniref:Transposase n=1 Tax=Niallia alba TaxID=2729105 RepID=A0A7Y0K982_9BACI|nr:transposase [Bacillus sp. (in: firmicutes)]MBZ9535692.1 transposase [Cytobacillus oceanisediminis]NMO77439.1 transposase [Niallia alba]